MNVNMAICLLLHQKACGGKFMKKLTETEKALIKIKKYFDKDIQIYKDMIDTAKRLGIKYKNMSIKKLVKAINEAIV
jgi:NH3-dependent NAD+ synthetase